MLSDSAAWPWCHGAGRDRRPSRRGAGRCRRGRCSLPSTRTPTRDVEEPVPPAAVVVRLLHLGHAPAGPRASRCPTPASCGWPGRATSSCDPAARYASLSNPAFDALSFEVWVPLLTGGCCVVLDDETVQTPELLAAALRRAHRHPVHHDGAVQRGGRPGAATASPASARCWSAASSSTPALIRRWYRDNPGSRTVLHNVYGPTETTTFALCHPIPRDFDGDVVPIGRPLPGTEALLVTDDGRLAADGEIAELYLGGEAARRSATATCPTRRRCASSGCRGWTAAAERYYRSGDLVRRDADGLIELRRPDRPPGQGAWLPDRAG